MIYRMILGLQSTLVVLRDTFDKTRPSDFVTVEKDTIKTSQTQQIKPIDK